MERPLKKLMDETGKALPGKKGGMCGLQDLRAVSREEGGEASCQGASIAKEVDNTVIDFGTM